MNDVFLSEEERVFQEEVAEFVARQIAPRAEEIDREDQVPDEVFKALNAYTTLTYPREYGGGGKGETYACIVVEEVGQPARPSCRTSKLPSSSASPFSSLAGRTRSVGT